MFDFISYPDVKLFSFILVSPCDSVTCQNEGSCRVEAGVAACFCKGDYSGSTCEGMKL
jgi:hypothetical protein